MRRYIDAVAAAWLGGCTGDSWRNHDAPSVEKKKEERLGEALAMRTTHFWPGKLVDSSGDR